MPAALLSAGATIIGGALTSRATSNASRAQQAAAAANTALQREQYERNRALYQPSIDRGGLADERMAAFLGLSGDAEASKKAFQGFLDSTGYQFQLDQGMRAVTGAKAAAGMLNSGSTLRALNDHGQNTARTWANQYLGYLGGQAERGVGAMTALSGAGERFAGNVSANNNQAADARGSAAIAGAANLNGLLGSALSAIAGQIGASSYGGIKKF